MIFLVNLLVKKKIFESTSLRKIDNFDHQYPIYYNSENNLCKLFGISKIEAKMILLLPKFIYYAFYAAKHY